MRAVLSALSLAAAIGLAALPSAADEPKAADACAGAGVEQPATPPVPGGDATAPGNAGNTGWTGGTGGSHIGTANAGPTPASRTWQPPTARGLDLATDPAPAQPDC